MVPWASFFFFFFTPSLKEVWLKKRAQAKNEFYGALDESCRLRGMPSVPKPSSSVCLESRTGRDGDPTFDFKTSIRGWEFQRYWHGSLINHAVRNHISGASSACGRQGARVGNTNNGYNNNDIQSIYHQPYPSSCEEETFLKG